MVRLACPWAGGEWQGVWARRDGVQAGAPKCSLRGTESGPAGGDRGSECGSERAVECRPCPVRMQAATPMDTWSDVFSPPVLERRPPTGRLSPRLGSRPLSARKPRCDRTPAASCPRSPSDHSSGFWCSEATSALDWRQGFFAQPRSSQAGHEGGWAKNPDMQTRLDLEPPLNGGHESDTEPIVPARRPPTHAPRSHRAKAQQLALF
jgi:hypothetical protein